MALWTYVLLLDLDADRRWSGSFDIDGPDVQTRYSVWGERSGEQAMHIPFADARSGHRGPSPEPGAELFVLNELALVEYYEPERPYAIPHWIGYTDWGHIRPRATSRPDPRVRFVRVESFAR